MKNNKMTKLKTPSEGSNLTLIAIMFAVLVIAIMLIQLSENWREANNILTVVDMDTCMQEFNHVNYPECLKYLHDTDQKDISALWGADPTRGAIDYE